MSLTSNFDKELHIDTSTPPRITSPILSPAQRRSILAGSTPGERIPSTILQPDIRKRPKKFSISGNASIQSHKTPINSNSKELSYSSSTFDMKRSCDTSPFRFREENLTNSSQYSTLSSSLHSSGPEKNPIYTSQRDLKCVQKPKKLSSYSRDKDENEVFDNKLLNRQYLSQAVSCNRSLTPTLRSFSRPINSNELLDHQFERSITPVLNSKGELKNNRRYHFYDHLDSVNSKPTLRLEKTCVGNCNLKVNETFTEENYSASDIPWNFKKASRNQALKENCLNKTSQFIKDVDDEKLINQNCIDQSKKFDYNEEEYVPNKKSPGKIHSPFLSHDISRKTNGQFNLKRQEKKECKVYQSSVDWLPSEENSTSEAPANASNFPYLKQGTVPFGEATSGNNFSKKDRLSAAVYPKGSMGINSEFRDFVLQKNTKIDCPHEEASLKDKSNTIGIQTLSPPTMSNLNQTIPKQLPKPSDITEAVNNLTFKLNSNLDTLGAHCQKSRDYILKVPIEYNERNTYDKNCRNICFSPVNYSSNRRKGEVRSELVELFFRKFPHCFYFYRNFVLLMA